MASICPNESLILTFHVTPPTSSTVSLPLALSTPSHHSLGPVHIAVRNLKPTSLAVSFPATFIVILWPLIEFY